MAQSEIKRKASVERFLQRLAQRLREYREMHNYTQDELAEKLYTNKSKVSRVESGEVQPGLEFLAQLSQLYGCTLSDLIGDVEEGTESGTLTFARRSPQSKRLTQDALLDIERGMAILTALCEGQTLEDVYELPGLSQYQGNPDALFAFLHTAIISGEIVFTEVPRDVDLETQIVKIFPKLKGAVYVVDLPETMITEVIPPELVAWTAAHTILSKLENPSVVGLGYSCSLNRMCHLASPKTKQFSGTHWIPLVTYREHEESNVYAANYLAAAMKQRNHKSIAEYLPYVAPEERSTYRQLENIRRYWEKLNVAFVGGWGWTQDHNDHLPESHRLIISQLESTGRIQQLAGEFLGHFLDTNGQVIPETEAAMDQATTRIPLKDIKECVRRTGKVYFIGANQKKAAIVRVALKMGYINGLVTDSSLAKELLK